jgi:chromosome segregation ATPase
MTSQMTGNPNNEINIVEMLRTKTEEADMNSYLKSSFGGYTKKSVLDYLAILRRQQQIMAENFNRDLQTILEEKESIKKSNSALQTKLNKIESEYKNLSEAVLSSRSDDQANSKQDIPALLGMAAALEEELKKSKVEYSQLERKNEQFEHTNQNLTLKLEQANKETSAQKEMLAAEKLESKKQRNLVAELSGLLESERDETKYWKSLQYDEQIIELTAKVDELTNQLGIQTELIARQNSDIAMKGETIDNLNAVADNLNNTVASLTESFRNAGLQNEKLILANKALREHLEEEYKKTITLIQEKSDANLGKTIALKKLSAAEGILSRTDLQQNRDSKADEINRIRMEQEKTDR